MPTNPLPYQCGTPGCTRKFAKPEHLHQHTKDFHSPSRPAPSRSPPSRPPPSRSSSSRPPSSRSPPSGPPPKRRIFTCGAKGCERLAPFSQLSSLHQHTARVHTKSDKNTPSGSSISAVQRSTSAVQRSTSAVQRSTSTVQRSISAFSGGYSNPVTNTRSTRPVFVIQRLPPRVQYVYSQPSTSTSSAAQNAVSSSDYASVASDTQEELLQRLIIRQLELRQMLIDKSALKVGMHFVELAEDIIRSSTNDERISFLDCLKERVEWMSKHNDVCSLAYSAQFRTDVQMLLDDFGYNDNIKIQKVFRKDDQVISHLFRGVIHSGREEILHLSDEKATGFMDALHKEIKESVDLPFILPARRLLKNLCAATETFPPILFLELDSLDINQQIGRGGFADIFRGKYREQDIALKRLRVYKQEPNEMLEFSKSLLQEVLTWVHLEHNYVLPFLGLDEQFFEDYPPCIVTPYMRNGTMDNFVKIRNGTLPDRRVDKLLSETAQGLAYLHSQNIVHGDLRGVNVLIDNEEHAQLADFGLAIVTDATLGTTSTTQRGS